jgi:hypothetical protein
MVAKQRAVCPTCGRDVAVRSNGELIAHNGRDGRVSVSAAWHRRPSR